MFARRVNLWELDCFSHLYFLHINSLTTHNSFIRSDEGLTFKMSALKLFSVANLHDQLS